MLNKLKSRKALVIYGASALSVSLVCLVLRLICMLFFFDSEIGYYESGALTLISNILPTVASVAAVALFAIPALRLAPNAPVDSKTLRASAIAPTLGFAAFSFIYIRSLVELSEFSVKIPTSFILGAVCALASFAFFLVKALGRGGNTVSVICGILTVVWVLLALMESYFDMTVQMNSPIKVIFQISCLAAMLMTVSEMRVGVDTTRTHFHLLSATLASLILPFSTIPTLVCHFTGKLPSSYTLEYYDIVLALISVLAVARLVQMCFFAPVAAVCEECKIEANEPMANAPEQDSNEAETEEEA